MELKIRIIGKNNNKKFYEKIRGVSIIQHEKINMAQQKSENLNSISTVKFKEPTKAQKNSNIKIKGITNVHTEDNHEQYFFAKNLFGQICDMIFV